MKKFWICLCLLIGLAGIGSAQKIPKIVVSPSTQTEINPIATIAPPYLSYREGRLKTPLIYDQWWREAMECTGLKMPMDSTKTVEWYYVDAMGFKFPDDTLDFLGYTFFTHNRIILVRWGIYSGPLVKHEMTHYLMGFNHIEPDPTADSIPGHPSKYFADCGFIL